MTGTLTLDAVTARAEAELAAAAPHLVEGYRAALPRAGQTVGRRLLGALCREDIADSRRRYAIAGRPHAFDRVEFDAVPADDPVALLPASIMDGRGRELAAELTDAVVNLAVAYARREPADAAAARSGWPSRAGSGPDTPDADDAAMRWERLAVDGHNLHPCARTRLGWRVPDLLAHDLEANRTRVGFVAVRGGVHLGDDLGAALDAAYPQLPPAPAGYRLQPVHAWQLESVVRERYADLIRDRALRVLPAELPAEPTAALRTLLLPPGADGRRRYLKLSLDILVTSTRRTVSVASARNGPAISTVLHRLMAEDPAADRVLLLPELAGAAVPAAPGRERDLSAILRGGLDHRLHPGESVVPGGALPAVDPATGRTVLAGIVDEYARTRAHREPASAALAFVDEYAELLLPPVLRLASRYGVGLEAHLQNCLPTFVAGVPRRIALRDFAGLRLHEPRLAAAGIALRLWPDSSVATDDDEVLRAKIGYTALQAHLGEMVVQLVRSHGLDESAAWRRVRAVVDTVYDDLRADPASGDAAAGDHAFLTAPRVPHKALVRMRLAQAGDIYRPVSNPLHGASGA